MSLKKPVVFRMLCIKTSLGVLDEDDRHFSDTHSEAATKIYATIIDNYLIFVASSDTNSNILARGA
jgi:hypothetical protein